MPKFRVRMWVDLEIVAETKLEAKKIADKTKIAVDPKLLWEIQTADIRELE